MPKGSLGSMSIDARLKLRDEVGKVFTNKANELNINSRGWKVKPATAIEADTAL